MGEELAQKICRVSRLVMAILFDDDDNVNATIVSDSPNHPATGKLRPTTYGQGQTSTNARVDWSGSRYTDGQGNSRLSSPPMHPSLNPGNRSESSDAYSDYHPSTPPHRSSHAPSTPPDPPTRTGSTSVSPPIEYGLRMGAPPSKLLALPIPFKRGYQSPSSRWR